MGAVVAWLVLLTLDQEVWIWALAIKGQHCVVFLSKTFYSHSASLHQVVQMGAS